MLWCGVLCCVVLWRVVLCCAVACCGVCSPFHVWEWVPFSLCPLSHSLLLSFREWPAEVHRITGAGRQSPVRQTELIIGIRHVHNEVSAWTSRTTLRWWTASKTTCSTEHDSVRHLTGKIPGNTARQPVVKCHHGLSSRRIRSMRGVLKQLTEGGPRPTSGCPDSIRRERRRRSPASPHSVPRCWATWRTPRQLTAEARGALSGQSLHVSGLRPCSSQNREL